MYCLPDLGIMFVFFILSSDIEFVKGYGAVQRGSWNLTSMCCREVVMVCPPSLHADHCDRDPRAEQILYRPRVLCLLTEKRKGRDFFVR